MKPSLWMGFVNFPYLSSIISQVRYPASYLVLRYFLLCLNFFNLYSSSAEEGDTPFTDEKIAVHRVTAFALARGHTGTVGSALTAT